MKNSKHWEKKKIKEILKWINTPDFNFIKISTFNIDAEP